MNKDEKKDKKSNRPKVELIGMIFFAIAFYVSVYWMVPHGEKLLFFVVFCFGGLFIPMIPLFVDEKLKHKWQNYAIRLILSIPMILAIVYLCKLKIIADHNYVITNSERIKYKIEQEWSIIENDYLGDDWSFLVYNNSAEERIEFDSYFTANIGDSIDLTIRATEKDELDYSDSGSKDISIPVTINFGKEQKRSDTFTVHADTRLEYETEEEDPNYVSPDYGTAKVRGTVTIKRIFEYWEVLFANLDYSNIETKPSPEATVNTIEVSESTSSDSSSPLPTVAPQENTSASVAFDYRTVRMHSVDSTAISELGYSSDYSILLVRFLESGTLYGYYDVPESEYKALDNAESIGKYYNQNIKGSYDCERLEN